MLFYLVALWLRRHRALRLGLLITAIAAIVVTAWWASMDTPMTSSTSTAALRLGTFNIEHFPRSDAQVERVFALIEALEVNALAVQEILDPKRFEREARARLGRAWRFVYSKGGSRFRLGVLYDGRALKLLSSRTILALRVEDKTKPGFEARFRDRDGDILRVITVHFASTNARRAIREKQHAVLRDVVAEALESGERLVVMGDFNATLEGDREDIAALARDHDLFWASESLGCTAYWQRRDRCQGTALDHIVSWKTPAHIDACGACREVGCDPGERCPEAFFEVSDHCPVTFDLD
jgi:endonuclease/exonuclease/phosphatase family metal-dependent hydrolase